MRKKRRKKRSIKQKVQRDIKYISKAPGLLYDQILKRKTKPLRDARTRLKQKKDGYPLKKDTRPFSWQLSDPLGINKIKGRIKYGIYHKAGLDQALKTTICTKRAIRRLTLFRVRAIGSGIKIKKRRIRNKYSNINCTRR